MALHNSEAQTIETGTATESLPDPTTVAGRTHDLTNTALVTAVWSSTGATPFQETGVNVATISVPAGQVKRVQSDGTRWVVYPPGAARKVFAATGVTDGAGNVTFNLTAAGFPVAPIVTATPQAASSNSPIDVRVTALTATSCTINVRQAAVVAVALIGLSVLVGTTVAAGVTIHLIATTPGTP